MNRRRLTDEEFYAISSLTHNTRLDSVIDIFDSKNDETKFFDYDEEKVLGLKEGLALIKDALAYPLEHDVSELDASIIKKLFQEFLGA